MIKINLRLDDSITILDDIKEPDIKLRASSLSTVLDAIISPLSCPVCGEDAIFEVTLVLYESSGGRIFPDHCCHAEFSSIVYRALPPLLKELKQS